MDIKIKLITVFCLAGSVAYGQSMPSLTTTPDARAAAMGNTGTATSADAYSIYWNTAKSVFAPAKAQIAYSYMPERNNMTDDFRMHSVAGFYKFNDKNAIMAGYRYFPNGKFSFEGKELKPYDFAIDLGYARKLLKGFSIGAAVRYLYSDLKIKDKEEAVVFDLGLYYTRQLALLDHRSSLSVGLTAANFGMKLDGDYVPGLVRAGGAWNLPFSKKHELMIAADFGYQILPTDSHDWDISAGAEYWFAGVAALRAGYHWGDVDQGNSNFITMGCGVKYHHLQADFSYQLASDNKSALDKIWRLSVGVDFGLFCKKWK